MIWLAAKAALLKTPRWKSSISETRSHVKMPDGFIWWWSKSGRSFEDGTIKIPLCSEKDNTRHVQIRDSACAVPECPIIHNDMNGDLLFHIFLCVPFFVLNVFSYLMCLLHKRQTADCIILLNLLWSIQYDDDLM